MATRRVEVVVPSERVTELSKAMNEVSTATWPESLGDGVSARVTAVVPTEAVEELIATLESLLVDEESPAIVVSAVEVFHPGAASRQATEGDDRSRAQRFFTRDDRLSIDELREDLSDSIRVTAVYLITILASAIIAALGLQRGQPAVVIGAMVIAPLLGPVMALAMAGTIGDWDLGRKALGSLVVGALVAFAATAGLGTLVEVDPDVPEMAARTTLGLEDVVLALASGVAGTLAFTRGLSGALVGVMIAVALMPPLAAGGLLVGGGMIGLGGKALLLFLTNLVGVNVAGIATFLFQGIPPRDWDATWGVLALWLTLLGGLATLILLHPWQP